MQTVKKLVIYGEKQINTTDDSVTYILESSNRDVANKHDIPLAENDKLLQFVFNDNTTWICDAATLHELFPESDIATKPPGERSLADDGFELPSSIIAPASGAERGILGSIGLMLLKVFAKKAVTAGVGEIAKKLEDKHLKNHIDVKSSILAGAAEQKFLAMGAGLFRVDNKFNFSEFDPKRSSDPFFLFIHGTNSDTYGAFNELMHAPAWITLHEMYKENVIAFQHRTLTESPLENAVKLANMLPDNATLHIISHSRGGIVGDILCMYGSENGSSPVGFTDESIELLKRETGRDEDISNIKELNKIFRTKKISVKKFIRVACPAAGTKLASKRLDHILNVFFNLLGADANPFLDILKELLSAAVSSKDDVNVLPGIEAQSPGSPFVKILNNQANAGIDGSSLAVISGNGTISLSGNGLLVVLGKLFYWQRNDLVVNTDSMYLGAKRRNEIQYFFDQGGDVNHIKYFENAKTCAAIDHALNAVEGEQIPGFKMFLQTEIPGSDRDDRGFEHGELFPVKKQVLGTKPIVVLLPGIMGSNIENKTNKLWLNYFSAIAGGLLKLDDLDDNNINATSVIKTSYQRLATRLSNNYDVVIYPFDWRKQLNDCAKDFDVKINSLLQFDQPIKIIGHSMGGVLVRDFIINHDSTWQKLNSSKGFKLLFLGSPLGGSFRIPTVLFGQDSIINSLNMLDLKHTKKELLEMFSKFPGILSLLPIIKDGENDFAKMDTWEKMKTVNGDSEWPLPGENELAVFTKYRNNIIDKRDKIDYSNMVYIAGKDKKTPCGYFNDDIPPLKELVFLYTSEGDQSVTWELGIPPQMEKLDAVYYVPVTHGALANEPDIFDGIEEILEKGRTGLLSKSRPVTRGEEKVFRAPVDVNFDMSQRGLENSIFGIDDTKEPITSRVPITVSVCAGDLCYATYPVLAGHFVNDGILYAEKNIDEYLSGLLTAKHQLGLYPGEIGTNEVFGKNIEKNFAGAIIAGLGEPGSLTSFQLAGTVEKAVSNYLLSIKDLPPEKNKIGISALIIGCGWGGLSVETSLKAIIEGVNNANDKATGLFKNKCKTIQHIEFVEIYLDKALSCMYALNKIESKENLTYNISIGNRKIGMLLGVKKRLPLDTSEDWWNRITVKAKEEKDQPGKSKLIKDGQEKGKEKKDESIKPISMVFGVTTGEAREDENELFSSTPLIDLFISEVSTKNKWEASTAKTIFELMIPNGFKEKLKRKGNFSWVLDDFTAGYPWELLQDNTVNAKPLCVNAGMIRQLITTNPPINIKRAAVEKALIIADPVLSGFIHQLPGAAEEGKAVTEIFNNFNYSNQSIINGNAADIVRSLLSDSYTIMHLAGHGAFDASSPRSSGVVIGKDVFLTVFDIGQMPVVPELVFVNCCHLGNVNTLDEKYYRERYKLAANIGTQLINMGVKAVIAAGWAVNDQAALDFAKTFYGCMFAGESFGDAVKKARALIYKKHSTNNTWGAYQCYGDPFFKLKKIAWRKKEWTPSYIVPEEAEIHLENLYNQLQMGKRTTEENLEELRIISKAAEKANISSAQITEKQALIFIEMAMYEEAVNKFESLLKLENAGFSFSSMEKYCNARAKLSIHKYFNKKASAKDKEQSLVVMDKVIKDLLILCDTGETAERFNLLASSYKRKAMIVKDKKLQIDAYKEAAYHYNKASEVPGNSNTVYSLTNAIEIEYILNLNKTVEWGGTLTLPGKREYKLSQLAEIKSKLKELMEKILRDENGLTYWDMVRSINIKLCQVLLGEKLIADKEKVKPAGSKIKTTSAYQKNDWDLIETDYKYIWMKAGSAGKKAAELEHLQFLVHSLSSINKLATALTKNDNDDLASQIEQLKTVYNDTRSKPSKIKVSTKAKPARKK